MIWRLDAPATVTGLLAFERVARSPVRAEAAFTLNILTGDDVPTPTLPFDATLNHCAPEEDARVKRLSVSPAVPVIARLEEGVDEPIPMFPFWRIVNIDTTVDDATLNGLSAVVVELCTLKAKVDDVALIPATVPLSKSVEVPTVVAVSQRVA